LNALSSYSNDPHQIQTAPTNSAPQSPGTASARPHHKAKKPATPRKIRVRKPAPAKAPPRKPPPQKPKRSNPPQSHSPQLRSPRHRQPRKRHRHPRHHLRRHHLRQRPTICNQFFKPQTGNWNDAGHPTGRKVAFLNSFAIEGHYFNFSTSGQWLWDELQILVPSAQNPYPILDAIQKLVTSATEGNARMAEEEWQGTTHRERMHLVSAAPAINLRPTTAGVEVHVRYITRAQERYATRTTLYQDVVALLHQRQSEPATASSPVGAGT
jgi:hypothetical protein